ncbi:UNVERIFIED_CONTAM: Polygalacturonase [Sesamum calycinum]|uniref:Polygalacturonase n=1 Tax=Sesamum calycinum TaxID=2727403 RepID=A0AAW2J525_9LAMI
MLCSPAIWSTPWSTACGSGLVERCALCSELEDGSLALPNLSAYLDQRLSKILKELRLVGRPLYCISTALSPSVPASSTLSPMNKFEILSSSHTRFVVLVSLYRPSSIKITNVSIKNVRGTTNSAEAVTLICSSLKPCENVEVGDVDLTYNGNQGPITTRCSNVKPKFVGKQNPPVCATTAKSA